MNAIRLATLLLFLLGLILKLNARERPSLGNKSFYSKNISSQFVLSTNEALSLKNQKIRIYYSIDSSGKVIGVVAAISNQHLRSLLEERFKQIEFKGIHQSTSGKVDLTFVLKP